MIGTPRFLLKDEEEVVSAMISNCAVVNGPNEQIQPRIPKHKNN